MMVNAPQITISRTYARVFEALDLRKNQSVAVKIIKVDPDEGMPPTAIREISLLRNVHHVNIIKLLDVHHPPDEVILITELCDTDLAQYICSQKSVGRTHCHLALKDIKFIVYQILLAVAYLHQHKAKITHRDIKPQNILMNLRPDIHVKLADFGLARDNTVKVYSEAFSSELVTQWYRAPELLLGKATKSMFGVDIWSIGCVMAELYTGKPLFPGRTEEAQLTIIAKKMGIFNEDAWPNISSLPGYFPELSTFRRMDISYWVPQIRDSGKDVLRGLLQCPTRESAGNHLASPWFDVGKYYPRLTMVNGQTAKKEQGDWGMSGSSISWIDRFQHEHVLGVFSKGDTEKLSSH